MEFGMCIAKGRMQAMQVAVLGTYANTNRLQHYTLVQVQGPTEMFP